MERERLISDTVRQAINSGKLPARKPDRVLGGLGNGKPCAVCGAALARTQMEIEAELERGGKSPGSDRCWAHPRCCAAWELEQRTRGVASSTTSSRPSGTPCRRGRPIRHRIEASTGRELPWHHARLWGREGRENRTSPRERLSEKCSVSVSRGLAHRKRICASSSG